jgi:hypothetical protein
MARGGEKEDAVRVANGVAVRPEFVEFPKIPRLRLSVVITEKIDGTNGCIHIDEDGTVSAGSRTRWITPEADNFGFAMWVQEHAEELRGLGVGLHYGEWWGAGVGRRYGLDHKRFSLFNTSKWTVETPPPACCHVVPVIARNEGGDLDLVVEAALDLLRKKGSQAAPGFMRPEGICIFHVAANAYFKVTLEKDSEWKGKPT